MAEYKRPGVYIEEISLFPPSVAGVSTAVPAFIGYTEFSTYGGKGVESIISRPIKINSLLDFTTIFGGPPKLPYKINIVEDKITVQEDSTVINAKNFFLYYVLKMFFQYGDMPCYIVSVGSYKEDGTYTALDTSGSVYTAFENALKSLEKEDEPTLILFPEMANPILEEFYYTLCEKALLQCEALKDRFVIMDVIHKNSDITKSIVDQSGASFRVGLGNGNLKYGAAYFPNINTIFSYEYDEQGVTVNSATPDVTAINGLRVSYIGSSSSAPQVEILDKLLSFSEQEIDAGGIQLVIKGIGDGIPFSSVITGIDNQPDFSAYFLIDENTALKEDSTFTKKPGFIFVSSKNGLLITADNLNEIPPKVVFNEGGENVEFEFIESDNKLIVHIPENPLPQASGIFSQWPSDIPFKAQLIRDGADEVKIGALTRSIAFKSNDNGLLITYSGGKLLEGISVNRFDFVVKTQTTPKLIIVGSRTESVSAEDILNAAKDQDLSPFLIELIGEAIETNSSDNTLLAQNNINTGKYNAIKSLLNSRKVTLPPSSSIAGIYAKVDRERGVWKAPANVSLTGISGPSLKITDLEHDDLNFDPGSGKSINAIRNYTGKGTLVMGARTLAGNDNEWRYINVRRLFNMVEESVKKATEAFIFEPNNITTWLKVKGMIESYLYGLWQRGALVGNTPEQAYFVNVGLGKTMTAQDILEGFMKVDIGMAAVRPAEFIILRFSHKMQEA